MFYYVCFCALYIFEIGYYVIITRTIMAASILLACGINESKLDPYIHISEESQVDGSFLISCIIGQRIRVQNSGVILVCLHQTFEHYYNAGMRLGYNLNLSKGKNLRIIEPITDIGTTIDLMTSKWILAGIEGKICELLLNDIQNQIDDLLQTKTQFTVIVDNLEFLLNIGATQNDLIKFCISLKKIACEKQSTIIAKLNNSNAFDVLNNKMITLSDLHFNIVKLKSGNFKEVDGKLIITKTKLNGNYKINSYEKEILYKINERNIRTFNPGEVGIKV